MFASSKQLSASEVPATSGDSRLLLQLGDVVLVQSQQRQEAAELFQACWKSAAIFVPIDPGWPPYLIKEAAASLSPRCVVADAEQLPQLAAVFPNAEPLMLESHTLLAAATTTAHGPDLPAAYLFTSGSTSTPKPVVHSRRSLEISASLVLKTFAWQPGERLLNLPELHTMSGLRNALLAVPLGGLEWLPSPAPERANLFDLIDVIAKSRCNRLVAGPSLIRQMALLGDRLDSSLFGEVRAIYCTGATLSASASEALFRRIGVPILNYYGLTETGGLCLSQDIARWDPTDTSLGHPVGCEARLVAADGSIGDEGELQVRSEQIMSGYLDDPVATKARFDGDWLRTGDIMFRDSCGRFHLRGRADLFIKTRSTERIHPEEIENVLELHPVISEAALVGVADPNGGERLVALVIALALEGTRRPTPHELGEFVRQKLGPSRTPNEIRFVDELPRLSSGKLSRSALKDLI
jgi:acyl-coenzyme A synthetase/AMP-(fatty) acid ligase